MPPRKKPVRSHIYKGNKLSPEALGYPAEDEKIGAMKEGIDRKKWIVESIETKNGRKNTWLRYYGPVKRKVRGVRKVSRKKVNTSDDLY